MNQATINMEREHYSDKGGHFMRGQTVKVEQQIIKLEGFNAPIPEVQYEQRRFIRRIPKSGK